MELEAQELIEKHTLLYEKLVKIPEIRNLIYRVDIEKGNAIGKPRFDPKEYQWPKELYNKLRNHLQEIRNFFDSHSYWFDNSLRSLLDTDKRRASKKSILFLLEKDVWQMDEVYGGFLIEKGTDQTIISYLRRDHKIQSFTINTINDSKIEQWICKNVIKQIQNQFLFLWKKLLTEIETIRDESYRKEPKISLKIDYLKEQLVMIKKEQKNWPEASLLSLGRLIEIWLLIELNQKHSPGLFYLVRTAELNNLIDQHQKKLLLNINDHYNRLKHDRHYQIDDKTIIILISEFDKIFN